MTDADGTLTAMNPVESQSLPTRITLISHAPTSALRRGAFPLDEPLDEHEWPKIVAMNWIAPRAQQVLCGPEKRTRETAQALGLTPSISAELADLDYGAWRGKEVAEIQATDREGLIDWLSNPHAAPHGGSSFVQLLARMQEWMSGQIGKGHTLAVTHSIVIRAAVLCALDAPPECFMKIELAPLTATDLRFNGRSWIARSTGYKLKCC